MLSPASFHSPKLCLVLYHPARLLSQELASAAWEQLSAAASASDVGSFPSSGVDWSPLAAAVEAVVLFLALRWYANSKGRAPSSKASGRRVFLTLIVLVATDGLDSQVLPVGP